MIARNIAWILPLLAGTVCAAEFTPEWVSARIEALQPRPEEKRFDEIGWAGGILPAIRLAGEHNRPVFLFTQDGRINTGRC
jgi:hypothetical protein